MAERRTARIRTGGLDGIEGIAVTAEVDLSRGLPGFHLVGLPGAEVRESRERVLSALRNSGRKVPAGRITVNLAPAAVRKSGAAADLAVALGVLAAGRSMRLGPSRRTGGAFVGELSLFGDVRPVRGLLAMVMELAADGCGAVVVPAAQAAEARLVGGIRVVGVRTLAEAVAWWEGAAAPRTPRPEPLSEQPDSRPDALLWPDLEGQALARKGAVLALAGRHHALLVGPPGTGKTRLARSFSALAPPLEPAAALEVTRIHGAMAPVAGLRRRPPLRAPHHTVSRTGLVGGGPRIGPGEVTLAHHGTLFLDEMTGFAPSVLDALREPLADGQVSIVRSDGHRTYPAAFQLVGAINPCRCGHLGDPRRACRCTEIEIRRHRARLPGPLRDRFDLAIEVGEWAGNFCSGSPAPPATGSKADADWRQQPVLGHVTAARAILARHAGREPLAGLTAEAARCLEEARQNLGLSLRGVVRCAAVAGTAAALDGRERARPLHVGEALEFRPESVLEA